MADNQPADNAGRKTRDGKEIWATLRPWLVGSLVVGLLLWVAWYVWSPSQPPVDGKTPTTVVGTPTTVVTTTLPPTTTTLPASAVPASKADIQALKKSMDEGFAKLASQKKAEEKPATKRNPLLSPANASGPPPN